MGFKLELGRFRPKRDQAIPIRLAFAEKNRNRFGIDFGKTSPEFEEKSSFLNKQSISYFSCKNIHFRQQINGFFLTKHFSCVQVRWTVLCCFEQVGLRVV
jgi:hypothetical protein